MANNANCPAMGNILRGEQCFEHLAGLGNKVYVGIVSDLESPMTATENVYSGLTFKAGKGLYRIDGKKESQKYGWSSLGFQRGYELTGTFVHEVTNAESAVVDRALNTRECFFIFVDDDQYLILYDPNRSVEADSGGIAGDTGDTADSDRQTQYEFKLRSQKYTRLYVELPQGKTSWDDLLASAL